MGRKSAWSVPYPVVRTSEQGNALSEVVPSPARQAQHRWSLKTVIICCILLDERLLATEGMHIDKFHTIDLQTTWRDMIQGRKTAQGES